MLNQEEEEENTAMGKSSFAQATNTPSPFVQAMNRGSKNCETTLCICVHVYIQTPSYMQLDLLNRTPIAEHWGKEKTAIPLA